MECVTVLPTTSANVDEHLMALACRTEGGECDTNVCDVANPFNAEI